jgi:hypothetical protein
MRAKLIGSVMATKCITRHRDFNCYEHRDGTMYCLLGGKDGLTEPLRVKLPHCVRLDCAPDLNRLPQADLRGLV